MISNTKAFPKHLDRDVNFAFFDNFARFPSEFDKVFTIGTAPAGNHYREIVLSPLGNLREVPEGTGIQFDSPVEGNDKTIYYTQFGLGFQITQIMVKDDLQKNFMKMPAKLSKSASDKKEVEAWDLFNNGFVTTYHTAVDGAAIFSNSHTTLKSLGTIDNLGTAASLSETSLLAAYEYFDTLVDEAGMFLAAKPKTLVVPTELRGIAERTLRTPGLLGSANNDLSMVGPSGYFGPQLFVSHYLTSATAWFVLSDLSDFRFWWKEQPTLESKDDFYTGNALFKVLMRFAAFCMEYRGSYGNQGA